MASASAVKLEGAPMSLAPWVVSDGRWKRIESLLPNIERRFRFPGRKRVPDRRALQGILFVLYTGIAWATSAARARFRFRLDLLPADGRVAAGGSVASAKAPSTVTQHPLRLAAAQHGVVHRITTNTRAEHTTVKSFRPGRSAPGRAPRSTISSTICSIARRPASALARASDSPLVVCQVTAVTAM